MICDDWQTILQMTTTTPVQAAAGFGCQILRLAHHSCPLRRHAAQSCPNRKAQTNSGTVTIYGKSGRRARPASHFGTAKKPVSWCMSRQCSCSVSRSQQARENESAQQTVSSKLTHALQFSVARQAKRKTWEIKSYLVVHGLKICMHTDEHLFSPDSRSVPPS